MLTNNINSNTERGIGGWTLSNHGGLTVLSISNCGDCITVRYYDNEEITEHEIIYEEKEDTEEDEEGNKELEPCINYNGSLYFLSDCMRF